MDEHILVCLSAAPSNQSIIRSGAEMADVYHGVFTAIFVETPSSALLSPEDQKRLDENIEFARVKGAKIERTYGDDIAHSIAEYARLNRITKIVIGQSGPQTFRLLPQKTLTDRLMEQVRSAAVYIIPDPERQSRAQRHKFFAARGRKHIAKDVLKSLLALSFATVLGFLFARAGVSDANIITLYILAVLIIAVMTSGWGFGVLASAASVIIFNFFFTPPFLSFHAYDTGYWVTFGVMFIAAIMTGLLASRLKEYAEQTAQRAYRIRILFDTNQLLQQAEGEEAILEIGGRQIVKLIGTSIVLYPANEKGIGSPYLMWPQDLKKPLEPGSDDKRAAEYAWYNHTPAGAGTGTYPRAGRCYLPAATRNRVYGVIGIPREKIEIGSFAFSTCNSILGECALAAENDKNAKEKEASEVLARDAELRANLLRSLSHDLRTPLTSIYGNADTLLHQEEKLTDQNRKEIYRDIYDDSVWLINTAENLLAVTRLTNGQVKITRQTELIDDVIDEAIRHVDKKIADHHLTIKPSEDLLLADLDPKLMVQVVVNLVNNAVKYTPAGSEIQISSGKAGHNVFVSVADNGPGMSDEAKARAFELFYTGARKIADSRRSLGLGLALCKSILEAHGGRIDVRDNHPRGTVFTFSLPEKELAEER